MHEGHRQRLRQRFATAQSLKEFEEHQILELLLFYAIPRKDTNEIAHSLIKRFGSLAKVLSADITDIAQVEGMGMYSATLIKLTSEVARTFWIAGNKEKVSILGVEDAINYACALLKGKPYEELFVICLDKSYNVQAYKSISSSSVDTITISVKAVAEIAIRNAAAYVIIAHNHPGGVAVPSDEDIALTLKICDGLNLLGIGFADHIIVAEEDFFSFSVQKLLKAEFPIEEIKAAQYSSPLYKYKK